MGKASRERGKRGERQAAELLRSLGFSAARRGQQFSGGADSPDVVGIPRCHLEIKFVEALNIHSAMTQSATEAAAGEIPLVMHRRSRGEWMVTVKAEQIVDLARAVLGGLEVGT